jgi:diaminopimelate epimerase
VLPRRTGIGAHGFVLLRHGKETKVAASFFGAQGREQETDADALRCAARYAFDAGLLDYDRSQLETAGRAVSVRMLDGRNVAVSLPPPKIAGSPVAEAERGEVEAQLSVGGRLAPFTPVELYGPHAAFLNDPQTRPSRLAGALARHPRFRRQRPTVEIVQLRSPNEIGVRVWRPNGREIPAGSPAAAAATVASVIHDFAERELVARFRGGDLFVNWESRDDTVIVAGAVDYVFTGTYYWETWEGEVG